MRRDNQYLKGVRNYLCDEVMLTIIFWEPYGEVEVAAASSPSEPTCING
jgi:hypothetical protein